MPQLLWIGCLESDEEFVKKAEKGYTLASAQVSQKNLIEGLKNVSGLCIDSINGSVLPHYPVYKDEKILGYTWFDDKDSKNVSVGYKNAKYVNRVYCKNAMIEAADDWINERYSGDELYIFVYSLRSAPLSTACHIKKRIRKAKIFLIVTDLPQYMDLGESRVKKFLKSFDWIYIKHLLKNVDKYILYSRSMAGFLKIPEQEWIVMEGSYDTGEFDHKCSCQNDSNVKAILYSGKLDRNYGINLLIDQFHKVNNEDLELWLTGDGNCVEYIRKISQIDKRIKYYGFLPNRKEVLSLQKKASFLINMRLPSEPSSKYCFPSKLFEYMASGKPVLTMKLEGIPEEYFEHLFLIGNQMSEDIERYTNMRKETLEEKASLAKEFIVKYKNKNYQCRRIWEFVNNG